MLVSILFSCRKSYPVFQNFKFDRQRGGNFLKKKPELLRAIATKDKYQTTIETGEIIVIDHDSDVATTTEMNRTFIDDNYCYEQFQLISGE